MIKLWTDCSCACHHCLIFFQEISTCARLLIKVVEGEHDGWWQTGDPEKGGDGKTDDDLASQSTVVIQNLKVSLNCFSPLYEFLLYLSGRRQMPLALQDWDSTCNSMELENFESFSRKNS